MHRDLKELLRSAGGDSEHVIAVNADVRGFTRFSERVESVQAALFVQRMYQRILDDFYTDATFFKLTGDGLMLIFVFTPETLIERSRAVIGTSLRLVSRFKNLCKKDPMLNFRLPDQIGIGVARGAATRLTAEDGRTLDYSGRPLNLAARLMDLARPEGVVVDESFRPFDVLTATQMKKFVSEVVYLRSIAEKEPIKIYHTEGLTKIPEGSKKPLDTILWKTLPDIHLTLREIKKIAESLNYRVELPTKPLDDARIVVQVIHSIPRASGSKHPSFSRNYSLNRDAGDFSYIEVAGKPLLLINCVQLHEDLEKGGIKASWDNTIRISYPQE